MYGQHQEAFDAMVSRINRGKIIAYPIMGLAILILIGSIMSYANPDAALSGATAGLALLFIPYHEIDAGRSDQRRLSQWEDNFLTKHTIRHSIGEDNLSPEVEAALETDAPPTPKKRNWLIMSVATIIFLAISIALAPSAIEPIGPSITEL